VYGILLRAKASIDKTIIVEDSVNNYIETFLSVIRKYKLGEIYNFKGYLYVAWKKVSKCIMWNNLLTVFDH